MPPATDPGFGVEYYGETLRRHVRLIAIAAIVGLLLASLFLFVRPARTTATADVRLTVVSTNPFDATKQSAAALDATTETQLATSQPVAVAASEQLDGSVSPRGHPRRSHHRRRDRQGNRSRLLRRVECRAGQAGGGCHCSRLHRLPGRAGR